MLRSCCGHLSPYTHFPSQPQPTSSFHHHLSQLLSSQHPFSFTSYSSYAYLISASRSSRLTISRPLFHPSTSLVTRDIKPRRTHYILLRKYALPLAPHLPQHASLGVLVFTLRQRNDAVLVQWRVADGLEAFRATRLLFDVTSVGTDRN